MVLDPEYSVDPKHALFKTYITIEMSGTGDNDVMLQAFQYYGKMSKADVFSTFAMESGPFIRIIRNGESYYPDMTPDSVIDVPQSYPDLFELDSDIIISHSGKKLHSVGAYILYWIVYNNNGHDTDLANAFLKNVYGIDKTHPWRQAKSNAPYDALSDMPPYFYTH